MNSLQANNPLTQSQPLESVNLATMERQLQLLEPNAAMQLRDRVLYQFNQKIHTAEVRISPEDLGTVQIKVNLQQDQLAVQFVVQQANAKELIEQQMPKLKELLQQQGMNLTEGQVEQRQSNDRQGSQQPDERQANRGYAMGTDIEVELPVTPKSTKASERMVDYYA
jgi:flagellar hook-length control protein FliK